MAALPRPRQCIVLERRAGGVATACLVIPDRLGGRLNAGRVGVSVFAWGTREAESVGRVRERSGFRGPLAPGGLRDGRPNLPIPRASRSPVALTRVDHAARGTRIATATATAHASRSRGCLGRRKDSGGLSRAPASEMTGWLSAVARHRPLAPTLPALADSVVLATARQSDATLWTQDADFEGLPDVRFRARKSAPRPG